MKKSLLYFLLVIFCSCQSQEIKKQDIIGNWYPEYTTESSNSYFELYIDKDKFHYMTKVGWGPFESYKIDGNTLYIENFDEQGESYMQKEGSIFMDSGKMIIKVSEKKTTFIRLDSSPNIGDCINGKFDGDKLLGFVLERQAEWKKNK